MLASSIRYISFDCYGTLTDFRLDDVTRQLVAGRVDDAAVPAFLEDFRAYRFDEVLGPWKPYPEVLFDAFERCCRTWSIACTSDDGEAIVRAVPTWGPHADVPAPLAKVGEVLPLVILSNAADDQIHQNVDQLGAPFHAVLTAEQAKAYKPRFQAFEYMFDTLDAGPEHFLHVSSSLRYDLMTAHDLRIADRVLVARGHGPTNPVYGYREIADLRGLPGLLGLS
ncbi:MAG: haloacid dehalogenase type II [Actinomycetota bacterium]